MLDDIVCDLEDCKYSPLHPLPKSRKAAQVRLLPVSRTLDIGNNVAEQLERFHLVMRLC